MGRDGSFRPFRSETRSHSGQSVKLKRSCPAVAPCSPPFALCKFALTSVSSTSHLSALTAGMSIFAPGFAITRYRHSCGKRAIATASFGRRLSANKSAPSSYRRTPYRLNAARMRHSAHCLADALSNVSASDHAGPATGRRNPYFRQPSDAHHRIPLSVFSQTGEDRMARMRIASDILLHAAVLLSVLAALG
jgi:hypothetical protein